MLTIKYYDSQNLRIYYNKNDYLVIELHRDTFLRPVRGDIDEDDENYEQKKEDHLKEWFEYWFSNRKDDIVIYNNNSFTKELTETKYRTLVENEITKHEKKWCDIVKIVKVPGGGASYVGSKDDNKYIF